MFCKVCFDASKSGHNSHNVRDRAGNVVCPILLNTKCRACGYFGHTTKYCKKTVKHEPKLVVCEVVRVPVVVPSVVPVVGKFTPTNMFAMLDSDTDTDSDSCVSDDGEMDFENDPIIWGVGLKSMIGKRWADVLGY
jgi:hypothetical protein|uniref:Nanos-type domain-containing protein n=1 Tax=viral metagenome TaxID=1070528 RepID=A0A6C0CC99_9ZZZZ